MKYQTIMLHAQAPAKPELGRPCNGCGVCCAVEPCPAGVLISRRVRGACTALQWNPALRIYRCAVVEYTWPMLPRALAGALQNLAQRWISAGSGCDCSLQATPDR